MMECKANDLDSVVSFLLNYTGDKYGYRKHIEQFALVTAQCIVVPNAAKFGRLNAIHS